MTLEEKDKILKLLAEDRNNFAEECNRIIAKECGKIAGADYILQRLLGTLRGTEVKKESEEECQEKKL